MLQNLAEMAAALGESVGVDLALAQAVRAQTANIQPEEHYNNSCLLMVSVR